MSSESERIECLAETTEALRGHLVALDHAVRLLLAATSHNQILREAWLSILAELTTQPSQPSQPLSDTRMYDLALRQCANRITHQLAPTLFPDDEVR